MPRTLAAGELWKKLTRMRLIRLQTTTPGQTTTTAAVLGTGAETTVAVLGITNFTAGDEVLIIGSGGIEATKIGTPATSMPVSPPPKVPQDIGARFEEAVEVDLGKIARDSVQWTATKALTAVFEEIGAAPVVYLPGDEEYGIDFALFGYNGPNLQTLMGYLESETGSGAAEATAYQSTVGLPNQALATEQVFRIQGLRHDGKTVELDFLNAYFQANISSQTGRGNPATLNGSVKASAIIFRQWT